MSIRPEQYFGVQNIELQSYLLRAEKNIIQPIPESRWPFRIREWANTMAGEYEIRRTLEVTRGQFLWLETEVHRKEIIDVKEILNGAYGERSKTTSHGMDIDPFRAFNVIVWGYPKFKQRNRIENWDTFITNLKTSLGSTRFLSLIHNPLEDHSESRIPQRVTNHKTMGVGTDHWTRNDSEDPQFREEEENMLKDFTFSQLVNCLEGTRKDLRTRLRFEKPVDESFDVSNPKIRMLSFINGVRQKLLRHQLKITGEFNPEKIPVNFDVNTLSAKDIVDTLEFTLTEMEKRHIQNAFEFYQQIKRVNNLLAKQELFGTSGKNSPPR